MVKTKGDLSIVILVAFCIFILVMISKVFGNLLQVNILKLYDDTTPLAHIIAITSMLSLFALSYCA